MKPAAIETHLLDAMDVLEPRRRDIRRVLGKLSVGEVATAYPTADTETGRTSGGEVSNPTEAKGLRLADPRRRESRLEETERLVRTLESAARRLDEIARSELGGAGRCPDHRRPIGECWAVGRSCGRASFGEDEGGCEFFAEIGRWYDARPQAGGRSTDFRTVFAEPLARPMRACSVVVSFAKKHGRRPTKGEMGNYDRTGRWKVRTPAGQAS